MDFIEGFPNVGEKSMVDRLSKFTHFIALSRLYSAASVAKAFFDGIVRLHGISCSIVSDRDTMFTSIFWYELFKLAGITLKMSSTFHPQIDGQSEVINKVITIYLRCLTGDRPRSWLQWLSWAEFCYNSSYHTTLPFKVVYGRDPPALISYKQGASKVVAVDKQQQLKAGDEFLREIQDRLLQSQVTMKSYHDQHWHEVVFQEGDWVWLRLQQRTTVAISAAAHSKLSPKYYGPYKILQHISKISYKLELPSRAKIHNVFHVSVLKKYEGAAPKQIVPLPDLLHGRVLPTPDRVLRARLNKGVWELLVQWTGQPAANATWQPLEDFKVQFSWVELADELFVDEGGNVVDAFVGWQYS
jgi:hypothetical protein